MAIPTLSKRPKCFGPIFVDILSSPIYRLNTEKLTCSMFTRASRRASWATESTPCKYCFNYQSLSTLNRAKVVNDEHDGQYRNNNNTHPECSMLGWGCKEQYAK